MAILKNQKHEKFAQIVASGESAGAAYRKVYHAKASTCETEGPAILRKPQVRKRVEEIQSKAEDKTVMTLIERRRFLADVVRTPISEVTEESALAQSYEFITLPGDYERQLHKLKVPDKLKAIELDSRLAGDFKDKLEVSADGLGELLEAIRGGKSE